MKNSARPYLRTLVISGAAIACTSALTLSASAAVGDVAGKVYESDIKTYFFSKRIISYNIGGNTVVPAEDLLMLDWGSDYLKHFDVRWDSEARSLTLFDGSAQSSKYEDPQAAKEYDLGRNGNGRPQPLYPRSYFDQSLPDAIYETDIKTYFETPLGLRELTSYNIGGKTCIVVEELMSCGYNVNWNAEARTLTVEHYFDNRPTEIDIGSVYFDNYSNYQTLVDRDYTVTVNGKQTTLRGIKHGAYNFADLLPLDELCELTGLEYELKGNKLYFHTAEATEFDFAIVPWDETPELYQNKLFHIDIDSFIVDGEPLEPTYSVWTGHFENTKFMTCPADMICYNGKAYISADYLENVIKYRKPEYIAEDKTAEGFIPIIDELFNVYELMTADSDELECDSKTQITASFGTTTARYNKVTDKRFDELGIDTLDELIAYFELYFSKEFVIDSVDNPSGVPQFIENGGELYKLDHNFEKFGSYDTYRPQIYLYTASETESSIMLSVTAVDGDENDTVMLTFNRDGDRFICERFVRFQGN